MAEASMNIEFEWIEGTDDVDCSLWLGRVNIGSVTERGGKHVAWFGHEHHALGGGFPTLDEAKAWVEEQARAWLAEVTKAQPDPRTVIALADGIAGIAYELLQSHEYAHGGETPYSLHLEAQIDRYMEASREFWAALSADGTGESPVLSTHLDVMGEGK